jgi:hypothetical protein
MPFDQQASQSSQRVARKSPLALILSVPAFAGVWYLLAQVFVKYQSTLRPAQAFLSSGTRVGNILMFVCPCLPSIGFGFMLGNVLERLMQSRETAREESVVYRTSQIGLAKFGFVTAAVMLPLSFIGANNFWALTPDHIDYREMFSTWTAHHDWGDVVKIETGCSVGKRMSYNFVLSFNNGDAVDVMEESPERFWAAYPEIQSSLRQSRYEFSSAGLSRCGNAIPRRWFQVLSRPPTGLPAE